MEERKQGYQPVKTENKNVTPPNTGSNVKKACFGPIGIPLKEVGLRLQELHDAIEKHGMAVAAENECRVFYAGKKERDDVIVQSAVVTVYFFQKA